MTRRRSRVLALIVAVAVSASLAGTAFAQWGRRSGTYDGRFTFVRLRWTTGTFASPPRGSGVNFWLHEFPGAEQNLMAMVDSLTGIDARDDGSLNLALDDSQLFKYPVAWLWEPGFWVMTDKQADRLREYLQKGGFIVFNDFELEQWDNFEAQSRRIIPHARWVRLDRAAPDLQCLLPRQGSGISASGRASLVRTTGAVLRPLRRERSEPTPHGDRELQHESRRVLADGGSGLLSDRSGERGLQARDQLHRLRADALNLQLALGGQPVVEIASVSGTAPQEQLVGARGDIRLCGRLAGDGAVGARCGGAPRGRLSGLRTLRHFHLSINASSELAARSAGGRHIGLRHVVDDHSSGAEAPSQRADGAFHPAIHWRGRPSASRS